MLLLSVRKDPPLHPFSGPQVSPTFSRKLWAALSASASELPSHLQTEIHNPVLYTYMLLVLFSVSHHGIMTQS